MSEWDSIVGIGRPQHSYGTCVRNTVNPKKKLKTKQHFLEPDDTLQGIALKYSTTTEELRRINKLFFSDSIFLRKFLLVPEIQENDEKSTKNNSNKTVKIKSNKTNKNEPMNEPISVNGTSGDKNTKDSSERITEPNNVKVKVPTSPDLGDVHSFLKKMDSQINASKKAAVDLTKKDISFNSPSHRPSRSEYHKSPNDPSTETFFSISKHPNKENEEDLFKL